MVQQQQEHELPEKGGAEQSGGMHDGICHASFNLSEEQIVLVLNELFPLAGFPDDSAIEKEQQLIEERLDERNINK